MSLPGFKLLGIEALPWTQEHFADELAGNRERQAQLPNYGKGIDKINDQMIRMQRDCARALLTHVNPHTRTSYAREPCVAIVEINNENSLLRLRVGSLPDHYRVGVLKKWNQWLKARYGSTEELATAWGGREELGTNLLPARLSTQGGEYLAVTNGNTGGTRISLLKAPEVSWHAQLHWAGLTLQEGQLYTLEFSARSELPRQLPLSTRLNKADWHNCGLAEEAELGPPWRTFSYAFRAAHVDPGAVRFAPGGKLEADVSKQAGSAVAWDAEAGLYTVNAPAAKAVVGRCTGRTTTRDGAEYDVSQSAQFRRPNAQRGRRPTVPPLKPVSSGGSGERREQRDGLSRSPTWSAK